MNTEIRYTLDSVYENLTQSKISFENLLDFCSSLNKEIFLLESVFDDTIASITRVILDHWICEIEYQIEKNHQFSCLVRKFDLLVENQISTDGLNQSFAPISTLYASIIDLKGRDEAGRPVAGILSKPFSTKLNQSITSKTISNTANSWEEWTENLDSFIEVVDELIQHFPASHHFGSLPCSTAILLRSIRDITLEQHKLSRTLKILSSEDERGHMFYLDTILIKQKLLPIPLLLQGEEE